MTTVLPTGGRAVMAQRLDPIDSRDAVAAGLRWYFTGAPCPHGHITKRSVSNRECRGCVDARSAQRRRERPELFAAKEARREPERRRIQARASYARNIEKRREYDRLRYATNPQRNVRQRLQAGEWWKHNRGKANFMVARRRAWVRTATPPWLTAEHKQQIRAFYLEAAAREGEWHVDHIVPLRGTTVCGLNVPWNLQILTGDDNRRKRNVFAS